jgi:hypothetical protein
MVLTASLPRSWVGPPLGTSRDIGGTPGGLEFCAATSRFAQQQGGMPTNLGSVQVKTRCRIRERLRRSLGSRVCRPPGRAGHVMFSVVTPYAADFFEQQGHGSGYAIPPLAQTAHHGWSMRARRHFTRHRGESLSPTQAHSYQVLGRLRMTPPPLATGWGSPPQTSPDIRIRALPEPTPRWRSRASENPRIGGPTPATARPMGP